MKIYTFVDNREIDMYEDFKLFKNLEDAEKMREAMKDEKEHFFIHQVEVIE